MPITMNPVEKSSNIVAEGFDEATGTLRVQFKSGGSWDYQGVDPDDYAAFAGAESKGRAIGAIKAKYDGVPLEENAADSEGGEL